MSTADSLPVEVLEVIFFFLETSVGHHPRVWYPLCLVNRGWYGAAITRLYRSFEHTGDYDERWKLWSFLHTIVSVPGLAAHVRNVSLLHCLKYTGIRSLELAGHLTTKYLQTIKQAILHAGLSDNDTQGTENIIDALRQDDRRPLVTLILSHLPNLMSLALHLTDHDLYFSSMVSRAVCAPDMSSDEAKLKPPAFQNLQQVCLASDGQPVEEGYPLYINAGRNFLFLPNLRELILISAKLDGDFVRPLLPTGRDAVISPHLTSLCITLHDFILPSNIITLLELVPPLVSLSIGIERVGYGLPAWNPASVLALWNCIARFKETLVRLDISGIFPGTLPSEARTFCPPLKELTSLETLGIEPFILRGGCEKHSLPFRLASHLPLHPLKHLVIYSVTLPSLNYIDKQLENIPLMDWPPEQITVVHSLSTPYVWGIFQPMEIACNRRGIPFSIQLYEQVGSGGYYAGVARTTRRHARPFNPGFADVLEELTSGGVRY